MLNMHGLTRIECWQQYPKTFIIGYHFKIFLTKIEVKPATGESLTFLTAGAGPVNVFTTDLQYSF